MVAPTGVRTARRFAPCQASLAYILAQPDDDVQRLADVQVENGPRDFPFVLQSLHQRDLAHVRSYSRYHPNTPHVKLNDRLAVAILDPF